MKDIIKKSFLLGLGAVSITMKQADKVVKELVKKNAVTIKEGKDMLKRVKNVADGERKRIQRFAGQEAKRLASNLSAASKAHIANVKRKLKSIDRELSGKGKKTLKQVLKGLSK